MRRPTFLSPLASGLAMLGATVLALGCGGGTTAEPTGGFELSLSPATLTIVQGGTKSTTLTIARTRFDGAVALSLSNPPTGITGSFSPVSATGTSSALSVSVASSVAPGTYQVAIGGTGSVGSNSTSLAVTVTSPTP